MPRVREIAYSMVACGINTRSTVAYVPRALPALLVSGLNAGIERPNYPVAPFRSRVEDAELVNGLSSHEWRSGRYHERTAGLGNTHGNGTNYSGRTFGSEFKRNYVEHLKEHARSIKGLALTTVHALHFGEIGAVMAGTTSVVEAVKGSVYLVRNPGGGTGILVGAIWGDAKFAFIAGGAGGLFSIGYDTAFMSAAEASYATTYDAVFAVLSRGRY